MSNKKNTHTKEKTADKSKAKTKQTTESADEKLTSSETQATAEQNIEALQEELAQAQQSAKDNWDQVLRVKAEMQNAKRRNAKDLESAHKYALDKFVKALLTVNDSLVMGLQGANQEGVSVETMKEGMEMINKSFFTTLEKFGVKEINPIDEKFNPELHEAMTMVAMPNIESQSIIEVVQTGVTLNDRLVRPARVIVAQ